MLGVRAQQAQDGLMDGWRVWSQVPARKRGREENELKACRENTEGRRHVKIERSGRV